jgi:8-amino-7-oxononanoate synthase
VKQGTPAGLRFLEDSIATLRSDGLFRERSYPTLDASSSFCSNDYLALAARAAPPGSVGAGASRLIAGERPEHRELERVAAELVLMPEALAFSSGYAANVGTLAALARPGDLIVSDALNHASLVDGARLSRARIDIVPHLDLGAIERRLALPRSGRVFVVTESYFSMDADAPDLSGLRALCDAHHAALIVDEAHALGVLGPGGRGLCAASGVTPDALVGTFGKAFGAGGAFVAGCSSLMSWLWNRARTFVFSTGLSPTLAAAAADGIRVAGLEPERRERVLSAANRLRSGLGCLGLRLRGFGHIVPWVVGDSVAACRLAETIRERGIDIRAVRPPSVPHGTARLRFTVSAAHDDAAVDRAVDAVAFAVRHEPRGTFK